MPGKCEPMRSEKEMVELILDVARADERVRAVILDGSRANPDAPRDPFQDYDIIYLVTDITSFKEHPDWIDIFGERMILQLPDEMWPPEGREGYGYLMQFTDGNRIDLTLYPVASVQKISKDSIRRVLLDKDGIVDENAISDTHAYLPKPPTEKEFCDCCNEFWWVCPYVAKGLWRCQIPYAKTMLDVYVREQMMKMLNWTIDMETGFTRSPGKDGKYFQQYLAPELWEVYLQTFADADYENTWQALFSMCELFRKTAQQVADSLHLTYPLEDDRRVFAYLQHVHTLPRDVKEIY